MSYFDHPRVLMYQTYEIALLIRMRSQLRAILAPPQASGVHALMLWLADTPGVLSNFRFTVTTNVLTSN